MSRLLHITLAGIFALFLFAETGSDASAQTMVRTTTPLQSNSESFFESSGIGWSVRRPGFFATFNNGGPIPPPFGGFNPQAGLQSGFSIRNKDYTANFNFHFAQGTQRFMGTTAPVLNSIQGQPASIFSGTTRPFVLGLIPISRGFGPQFSIPSGALYHPGNGLSPVQQAIANGWRPTNLGRKKSEEPQPAPTTATTTATTQDRSNSAFAFFGGRGSGGRPATVREPAAAGADTPSPGLRMRGSGAAQARRPEPQSQPQSKIAPAELAPAKTLQEELADLYYRKGQAAESSRDLRTAQFYYKKALSKATGERHQRIQQRLNALRF